MENLTQKTFKEAEQILKSAVERKITLSDACSLFDKEPDFMNGLAGKIEKYFKAGVITQKMKESLIGLYAQHTKIILNKNKQSKKEGTSTSKKPQRLTKGSKPAKSNKVKANTKASKDKNSSESEPLFENNFNPAMGDDDTNLTKQEREMLEYNADTDEKYEERSVGEVIRGTDTFKNSYGDTIHRISGYKYKIFIRDERPLTGEFSREEMDKIYRLYSSMDGAGLTLRAVSREFPLLNYRDFKRILRAFNITKASLAVAPHILEEYTEDEIVSLVRRNKENSILKKLDLDRQKYYEKKYYETKKEIGGIKSHSDYIENIVDRLLVSVGTRYNGYVERMKKGSNLTKSAVKPKNHIEGTDKPLFCIFGDIHFGKKFESPVFGRGYNKEIARERVLEIARLTIEEAKKLKTKEIVVICLGDLLESAMEDGMHPGHSVEMDLFQDAQIMYAYETLEEMVITLLEGTDCKITFCSIHGNHDRIGIGRDDDKNRTAGKVVTHFLKKMLAKEERVEVIMPKNNLLKLVRGKICVFAQHGDSAMNKKKPSELVNLWGEGTSCYHLLLKGHWHSLKADEGTNYLTLVAPSVTSADKYILEELGNNSLPGFILGNEPNCYGFDYKKITLF